MSTIHRLAYADWLEERGDTERAALVREAEGLACSIGDWGHVLIGARPDGRRLFQLSWYFYDRHMWISLRFLGSTEAPVFEINTDGTSSDDPRNWAWLLSLAMARGLAIPGLYVPEPIDPELET